MCHIQGPRQGSQSHGGYSSGTMYKLSIDHVPPPSIDSSQNSTALLATTSSDEDLTLWHNIMGHVNIQVLKQMGTHDSLQDFNIPLHKKLPNVCPGCAIGKQHKASYISRPSKKRSKIPGKVLHADMCGKMSQPSLGGALYYMLIKDDCTSYRFVVFSQSKE